MAKEEILDKCFVLTPLGATPVKEWLKRQRGAGCRQEHYGVKKVSKVENVYYLFPNTKGLDYKGITDGTSILESEIPKELILDYTIMICNK